jgi:hypothetical protein
MGKIEPKTPGQAPWWRQLGQRGPRWVANEDLDDFEVPGQAQDGR